MMLSTTEMALARETVARLLDDIGLKTYLFELEPGGQRWRLTVECAARDGWSRISLALDATELAQAADDSQAYGRLLAQCADGLADCERSAKARG